MQNYLCILWRKISEFVEPCIKYLIANNLVHLFKLTNVVFQVKTTYIKI